MKCYSFFPILGATAYVTVLARKTISQKKNTDTIVLWCSSHCSEQPSISQVLFVFPVFLCSGMTASSVEAYSVLLILYLKNALYRILN